MKKQKLAVVFAALLTMVGFSSCLNSEDDGITKIVDYAEVSTSTFGSTSFNSMYGWVCVPDKSLTTAPESQMAYIAYQYEDADLQSIMSGTSTSKNLPVTLLQDPVYLKRLDCLPTAVPETTKTVSIYSLGEKDALVWGENKYLILAPAISLKKGTTSENLSTELANHRLSLYYLSSEDDETAKTLKLYLRYEISGIGDSTTEETDGKESWASDYNIQYTNVSYVNLQSVISMYKAAHGGSDPEKVTVDYEYNNSGTTVPTIANKITKTVTYNLYKKTSNN